MGGVQNVYTIAAEGKELGTKVVSEMDEWMNGGEKRISSKTEMA